MSSSDEQLVPDMTLAEALPGLAINGEATVSEASDNSKWYSNQDKSKYFTLSAPVATFYCEHCAGERRFFGENEHGRSAQEDEANLSCYRYTCRDCREYQRVVILMVQATDSVGIAHVSKVAEWPRHGAPTDSGLLKSLGDWAPLFQKGVHCESLGLGAGAFTYYRATVEHSFRSLLAKIEQILRNENADADHVEKIRRASNENQFRKAVDMAKDHLPPALLVSGQNPLTLLHGLFSYDLHAADDQGALEKAVDMRQLLTLLVDRIRTSIEHHDTAKVSLGRLLKAQQGNRTKAKS
jgi:hypothetical protein